MSAQPIRRSVDVEHRTDVTVLTFCKHSLLDAPALEALHEHLLGVADEARPRPLLLNFGNVERFGTQFLGTILRLHKKLRAEARPLWLYNLDPFLMDLFTASGLGHLCTAQPGEEALPFGVPASRKSAEVVGADLSAPTSPGDDPPHVLVCDPVAERRETVAAALAPAFVSVPLAEEGTLARACRDTAAAVLPFPWPVGAKAGGQAAFSQALQFLASQARRLPTVVYADTDSLPTDLYCQALKAGAKQVVNMAARDFGKNLREAVANIVQTQQRHPRECEELTRKFAAFGLLGESQSLCEVFRKAVKASRFSDLPVLILGETGTGKQRFAEAIHRLDPRRRDRRFMPVNCSTFSKHLAESELFGHAKGAFTGATAERLGLFRAAHGGTVFLDEVGDLDLDLQPKLLRVLQEGNLCPVGEDIERTVDVRIIAATNRPLAQLVAAGKFRLDLYQRLHVLTIEIPPLRERPEDIAVQARHFLRQAQARRKQPVTDFAPHALEVLCRLPWGGNTRQLENCILEILADKTAGTLVKLEDLPPWMLDLINARHDPAGDGAAEGRAEPGPDSCEGLIGSVRRGRLSLREAMEGFERQAVQAVLEEVSGNRTEAARTLRLTQQTLYNKIRKYGLEEKGPDKPDKGTG
jgi:anti-anti-sigma factor